ncbi:MAG TPA: ATP-grasp domain-containing protein [Anaerolineae bacterium]|nr:ATP-grasp domain-containing protein [Anaerolineae bacterium]
MRDDQKFYANHRRHKRSTNKPGAVILGGDMVGLGIMRGLWHEGIPTVLLDHEPCISRFSNQKEAFFKCPNFKENGKELTEFLENLAWQERLNGWVIYPTNDEAVYFLAKNRDKIGQFFQVSVPEWDIVELFYDKRKTTEIAKRLNVPMPKTWLPETIEEIDNFDIEFPVVIKPAIRDHFYPATKKKAILVNNWDELHKEFREACQVVEPSELMIQDLIPGGPENLYSFCPFFKDGQTFARVIARRTRQHPMDFGHASTFVETVDIPELEEMGTKLLEAVEYRGICEVEFKYDRRDGTYKLLEVNTRAWGWHKIGLGAGVNFSYLMYKDLIGEEVPVIHDVKPTKWLRMATDLPTVYKEIIKGRLSFREYISSLRGKKEYAIFSWRDPLPFFIEFVISPYLLKKRGF